jgi:hypothetical protein
VWVKGKKVDHAGSKGIAKQGTMGNSKDVWDGTAGTLCDIERESTLGEDAFSIM